uniref:Uncharacterized protein n=1 Tax=Moniliophthora roreri TaxID=221103 RepID=A0A0W0FBE9_MONRR
MGNTTERKEKQA